jgi:hypothetical protein
LVCQGLDLVLETFRESLGLDLETLALVLGPGLGNKVLVFTFLDLDNGQERTILETNCQTGSYLTARAVEPTQEINIKDPSKPTLANLKIIIKHGLTSQLSRLPSHDGATRFMFRT